MSTPGWVRIKLDGGDPYIHYVYMPGAELAASGASGRPRRFAVRLTPNVDLVLDVFLDQPTERFYGFELMRASGLAAGTMYQVLKRLTNAGWLAAEWEEAATAEADGRPVRRYYRITPQGQTQAIHARDAQARQRSAASANLRSRSRPLPGSGAL